MPGDGPRLPARDPSDSRRNPASMDPTPTNSSISRSNPAPRIETQTRQPSIDSLGESIVFGKVNKNSSDILQPLDSEKGAMNCTARISNALSIFMENSQSSPRFPRRWKAERKIGLLPTPCRARSRISCFLDCRFKSCLPGWLRC